MHPTRDMGFRELNRYHEDLARLFRDHQRALVERHFGEALFRVERFHDALLRHFGDEERELLPAYAAVAAERDLPRASVFLAEHAKLREMLEAIRADLLDLQSDASPDRVVRVLEREGRFKTLFEHHALRELNVLFPTLDRCLDTADRTRILAACATRIEAMPLRFLAVSA